MTNAYDAAVQQTFIKSLRSVFLVDDAFPSFADMFRKKGMAERFKESERAHQLYRAFRKRHLPCDIENTFHPGDIQMVERMRKCDLIVLDFHLNVDDSDTSSALQILRRLANSEHFNTVVVYTKKSELNEVWLEIAANLRPDLSRPDDALAADSTAADWWTTADLETIDRPSESALAHYLLGGMENINKTERTGAIKRIREAGAKGNPKIVYEAMLRRDVARKQSAAHVAQDKHASFTQLALQGRFESDKPYWLQCRGCFIAIIKKADPGTTSEAELLMQGLREALLDWRPNFLQLLISEIQNRLELESLAADPRTFSDQVRQVALSHYLLQSLDEREDAEGTVEAVVDRVVETVRHKISADTKLRGFARRVLTQRRKALKTELESEDVLARARALAHVSAVLKPEDVLFFLNAFLSTESFGRSRVTTGTIFKSENKFWMVMSPACDLTSRPPSQSQPWMKEIHPVRAVFAISLEAVDLLAALKVATRGRHAFLQTGTDRVALQLLTTESSAPAPEMFFVLDAGRAKARKDHPAIFRAYRILRAGKNKKTRPKLSTVKSYVIVGQLRANYASRVLQYTGSHLARIGVDFFNSVQEGKQ
jgi:hypothetical protein